MYQNKLRHLLKLRLCIEKHAEVPYSHYRHYQNLWLDLFFFSPIENISQNHVTKLSLDLNCLTHFSPMSHFYTSENVRKPMDF